MILVPKAYLYQDPAKTHGCVEVTKYKAISDLSKISIDLGWKCAGRNDRAKIFFLPK